MQDGDNLISRRTHKLSCQSFQFTVQTDIHVVFFPVEGQLCGNIDCYMLTSFPGPTLAVGRAWE